MPTQVPLFIATTWMLAMLPGAGQALMLRQMLHGGRRTAWASIAGTCAGLLIWTTAAAAGLSAVLLANPAAYRALRIAGGVVLVVLGVSTLRAARASGPSGDSASPGGSGHRRAFAAGLATNLGNPKAGVFAVSLLPQFVTGGGPVFLSSIALGVLWALVTAGWYVVFTWAVGQGRAYVSRPSVHAGLRLLTGGTLLCLGAAVAIGV